MSCPIDVALGVERFRHRLLDLGFRFGDVALDALVFGHGAHIPFAGKHRAGPEGCKLGLSQAIRIEGGISPHAEMKRPVRVPRLLSLALLRAAQAVRRLGAERRETGAIGLGKHRLDEVLGADRRVARRIAGAGATRQALDHRRAVG